MSFTSRYRVICPRCRHRYNVSADDREIANIIDQLCPQCHRRGQDAYIAGRDSPVKA